MAKCIRCGKGGLFTKLNPQGLCPKCELKFTQDTIEKMKSDIAILHDRRKDEQALLAQALNSAEQEAQRKIQPVYNQLAEKNEQLQRITQIIDETRKKGIQLENRVAKLTPLVKSIKYAIAEFPEGTYLNDANALIQDMELLVPPAVNLNCLTIKELRTRYRQIERQIKDVYGQYQSRYTTKANATLYKLMVLALDAELQQIMSRLTFSRLDDAIASVKALTAKYYVIISDANQSIAPTLTRFTGQIESLYIDAVRLEYEYFIRRERAKEEQRAIREQMRQEAAERKELEQQRKKVESEERKYKLEIDRIQEQIALAAQDQIAILTKQLEEIQSQLAAVEDKKEEIINLQNGKAGTIYVISNLGAFGDGMFKIGMTRRLEPQERISELSSASVPFPFDVHSFIFSQDAVSMEAELHRRLNSRRTNKVNLRKEFFNVTTDELEALVTEIDPSAPFQHTMLAEQYRQSQSIDEPIEVEESSSSESDEDDDADDDKS